MRNISLESLVNEEVTNLGITLIPTSIGREEVRKRAMDIAQYLEQATVFQSATEQPGVLEIVLCNRAVPFEAQMHEVEVLCDDRVRRTREVERERVLDGSKVVKLEDEILRKQLLGAPDDPTNTDVGETEFVAGCID